MITESRSLVRTQIQLREEQYEGIRRLAHRRRISFSEAIRRLVDAAMSGDGRLEGRSGAAALLALSGIGRSGIKDLARRHDEYFERDAER